MEEIKRERQIAPLPPVVLGGVLVVPAGLLAEMGGKLETVPAKVVDTQAAAAAARAIVMEVERGLGFEPVDRELEKLATTSRAPFPAPDGCAFSR